MKNFFKAISTLPRLFVKIGISSVLFSGILFAENHPSFSVSTLFSNKTIALKDFKGKKVFIDFWATWCPPCRTQLERIDKILKSQPPAGCVFFLISVDATIGAPQAFMKRKYPHLRNNPRVRLLFDKDQKLSQQFSVSGIPSLFLINKEGAMSWKHVGVTPEALLLQKALS